MELRAEEHRQLWIPPGFAHGFLVLSDGADFFYKTTDYYSPKAERTVNWSDPTLAIDWPKSVSLPALSAKDKAAPLFNEAVCFE